MKKLLVISLLLIMAAGAANAGVISDIRTGLVAEGTEVTATDVVVTAVRYNGFAATEIPAGTYNSIWVYTGGAPGVVIGDVVEINAKYEEYYTLSELNVTTAAAGYVTVTGSTVAPVIPLTAAELMVDPEAYESAVIQITDGMAVCQAPDSYGVWMVSTLGSCIDIQMDDYWYDDTTVAVCDCYNWATGLWTYSYGAWELNPFADGIEKVDCAVPADPVSFGQVKSLFN